MIINIAHAGARSLAPENTLTAARKAKAAGADIWEIDVAVTADDELILFHDDSLENKTDAKSCFPDREPWIFTHFTLEEIKTLDAGSWFIENDPFGQIKEGNVTSQELGSYRGEKIPTVREALIHTRESGYRINLELKKLPPPRENFPVWEKVLEIIHETGIDLDRIVLSSFNHDWIRMIRKHEPGIKVYAIIGYPLTEPLDWGDLEFKTYIIRSDLLKNEDIRKKIDQGIDIFTCTLNEETEMKKFIDAGVKGIVTDFPQRLSVLLGKL